MARALPSTFLALVFLSIPTVSFASPLSFHDIVGQGSGAEDWERVPSARYAVWLQAFQDSLSEPLLPADMGTLPAQSRGLPGVVIFDYDNDGDEDIFVTNGPGGDNALLQSNFAQSGELTFSDQAVSAGVATTDIDASGACFGDIDNDGDDDLFVVAHEDQHVMFENNGDGTFTDVTTDAISDDSLSGTSCSMADIDNDGYLDIVVSHVWDQNLLFECFSPGFTLNQPTEVYLNNGNNTFTEVSAASGLLELGGVPDGAQGASWAVALVDYDLDGDVDVMQADDQCAFNPASVPGGFDRGFNQLWENDGAGNFTAVTVEAGLAIPGAWMGLSYADYDRDGNLDFFSTNMGDWFPVDFGNLAGVGYAVSRQFYGQDDGTFVDSVGQDFITTPFGWGTSSEDFDNDGDHDVVSLGALHTIVTREASNTGTIFINDGDGHFDVTVDALGTDRALRADHGVAAGDLNGDGLVDIVTASASDADPNGPIPFIKYTDIGRTTGSVFDEYAGFWPLMYGNGVDGFVWGGHTLPNGTISIEVNDTDTANQSVKIDTLGSFGITDGGVVNRSGFGAVIRFEPKWQKAALKPVVGGSSHSSQDSEVLTFGLGSANKGVAEVLWPGGVRNRLYGVKAGEHIVFPEIPCSYDDQNMSKWEYSCCVSESLWDLRQAGVLTKKMAFRFYKSAIKAWHKAH